ncbi:Cysteine-rich receptor-like protein kinase [Thalictrum thalictroides]|uniref:Cysteine-rich receptor-like protein kinase n=1 Tax=Thalictrum thalictroides TaxID=46969 RepID=A0A7J6WDB8_THATH|nr:Cysteine-rich receptor-like protein kinase [Thalictrum thalictroides]
MTVLAMLMPSTVRVYCGIQMCLLCSHSSMMKLVIVSTLEYHSLTLRSQRQLQALAALVQSRFWSCLAGRLPHLADGPGNNVLQVWQKWNENKVMEIMDPTLAESYNSQQLMRCIHIGLLCVQDHALDRPTMSAVVSMLGSEGTLSLPMQPAFTIERTQFSNILLNFNDAVSINFATITTPEGR